MFNKIFNKKKEHVEEDKNVMVAALLIHAAKIDDNYSDLERKTIKAALIELSNIPENEATQILAKAEEKEKESNQIVQFTKEIKKKSIEYKLKIIEILWKIVYSDGVSDTYESNLIRRVCGLLYVSDRDSGEIKLKIRNLLK
jgi:uncharacterized tellurite resistance protein B-like protein